MCPENQLGPAVNHKKVWRKWTHFHAVSWRSVGNPVGDEKWALSQVVPWRSVGWMKKMCICWAGRCRSQMFPKKLFSQNVSTRKHSKAHPIGYPHLNYNINSEVSAGGAKWVIEKTQRFIQVPNWILLEDAILGLAGRGPALAQLMQNTNNTKT